VSSEPTKPRGALDEALYRPAALAHRAREAAAHPEAAAPPPKPGKVPLRQRLRWHGRRAIPFVRQATDTDCGAACLAMVLGAQGRQVSLDEVRQAVGGTEAGADAAALLDAGARYGLRGRGLRIDDLAWLGSLPRGAILHWHFHHFIVLERVDRKGAWILDPAQSRRYVSRQELDRSFTGVALVLEKGESFAPGRTERRPSGLRRWLRKIARLVVALGATAAPRRRPSRRPRRHPP
jgi:predicted double-glycine peptidase